MKTLIHDAHVIAAGFREIPCGAVLGAFSIYYVLGFDKIREEMELGRRKKLSPYFGPLAKYVYVPLAVIVFVLGILYGGIG